LLVAEPKVDAIFDGMQNRNLIGLAQPQTETGGFNFSGSLENMDARNDEKG